jgi:hypothetical protein
MVVNTTPQVLLERQIRAAVAVAEVDNLIPKTEMLAALV